MTLLVYMPGEEGILLRRWYYARRFKRCGRNLVVKPGVQLSSLDRIEIGDDVMLRENVIIQTGPPNPAERRDMLWAGARDRYDERGTITVGDRSNIAFGAIILGHGGVFVGRECAIGPGAIVLSESYHYKGTRPGLLYKYSSGSAPESLCVLQGTVTFKDGAGVASNAIVLPGATIGEDSWVGPNSVVRVARTIEDRVIAAGDPATPVYRRLSEGTENSSVQ